MITFYIKRTESIRIRIPAYNDCFEAFFLTNFRTSVRSLLLNLASSACPSYSPRLAFKLCRNMISQFRVVLASSIFPVSSKYAATFRNIIIKDW